MKYPVSFVCDLSVIDFVKLGYRQDLGLVEKTSAVLSVDCQYWSQSQPSNWTLRPRYATLTKRLVDFQLKLGFPPSCRMARCRGTHEYDRGHRAGPVKFNMSEQPLLACMSRKKQYHQKTMSLSWRISPIPVSQTTALERPHIILRSSLVILAPKL
jgi:hypothetical protein